jgi:hypothetical protein
MALSKRATRLGGGICLTGTCLCRELSGHALEIGI